MRKGLLLLSLVCASLVATAQAPSGAWQPSRPNVIPYDDEDAILKSAYRESPYFMELSGTWRQRQTDSSIIYTRQLEAEKVWREFKVYLNVRCGRAVRVILNDAEVGRAGDSRHWNEFLLDAHLRYGRANTLAIEALRNPKDALLEAENLHTGLNGDPYLVFKSDPNIDDFRAAADFDPVAAAGTLSLDISLFNSKKKGRYYVEAEIWNPKGHSFDRMGRWVVFDKSTHATIDFTRTWSGVDPWSAESPALYTLVLRLRNEKMEEEEVIAARFGFRTVQVNDGTLLLNGKPVTLKGVTYGIEHTEGYAGRERIRQDLTTMKRNNINAVRTSRFSPMDPFFYDLCDELGLYVVCDANLLPSSSQRHAVATDQDFVPLFEHRVENLYGKYKNNTSIIAWSLGDTRDNGVCMAAAYKRLKTLDTHRPVVFAGADYSDNTDLIALASPSARQLRQALSKASDRPLLMLASVAAENFADLGDLWPLAENSHQLQGGFVDAWPLSADKLSDLKGLYSPFGIALTKLSLDDAEFAVFNRNDFSDFSAYRLEYTIFTNLRPNITAGDLPVAISGGGADKVSVGIPPIDLHPGEELFIRFDLSRRAVPSSAADAIVGSQVFALPRKAAAKPKLNLDDKIVIAQTDSVDGHTRYRVHMHSSEAAIDCADATLLWLTSGMVEFVADSLTLRFKGHTDWQRTLVAFSTRQPEPGVACIDAMYRYSSAAGAHVCDVRQTLAFYATGDVVADYTLAPSERLREPLVPEVAVHHHFAENDLIAWFGLDRQVSLPSRHSGIVGSFRQPLGKGISRQDVRWCALDNNAYRGLFVDVPDTLFRFDADGRRLVVTPCLRPAAKPSFRIHLRPYARERFNTSSVIVSEEHPGQLTRGGERPQDFVSVAYPTIRASMLEPPVIQASASRFSAPLTVSIASPSKGTVRYTLDGTEPSESSPLYSAPITLTTTTIVKARVFADGVPPSFTATRRFSYDYIVASSFSRKPNTPYNVGTDTILFDGIRGSVDDLTRDWLGFSGSGVTTTLKLAKPIDVESVTLRYAHAPQLWAFAPRSVTLAFSADGTSFGDTVRVELPFDPADQASETPQVVELSIPADRPAAAFVRIVADAIPSIPAWHRAKGLKPWLLMDEVEVIEK